MHQQNQPPTRRTLKRPPNNQRLHRLRRRTNRRASKENRKRSQHNELPAPDIRQRSPNGTRHGVGKQIGAANPGIEIVGAAVDTIVASRAETKRESYATGVC
jgi:hypothetical protein